MHGLRDSNSRHLVLETSALPTELSPHNIHMNATYTLYIGKVSYLKKDRILKLLIQKLI